MCFAQRRVGLRRSPSKIAVAIENIPIFVWNPSVFIAGPTNISIFEQSCIGKHESVRLTYAKVFDNPRKVVNVAFTPSAVQPEFHQIAIVTDQLLKFGNIVVVILCGVLVFRFVPVPGRKINTKLQSVFVRRV